LRDLIGVLEGHRYGGLRISGYADDGEGFGGGWMLSKLRAQKVAEFLAGEGIPWGKIEKVRGADGSGAAVMNRRVELRIYAP
jgi:hypothetical protein